MSGGAYEYTAAYVNNGSSVFTGTTASSLAGGALRKKQVYPATATDGSSDSATGNYELNSGIYGDAVYETSIGGDNSGGSWNGDDAYMGSQNFPCFLRGSWYLKKDTAGSFFFMCDHGSAYGVAGFRPVLCVER